MGITIVGLGPGDSRLMTREAWDCLIEAETLFLRTARHPAADDLREHNSFKSFDSIYDQSDRFDTVYTTIVETLITLAADQEIVYAVPGHPFVGESTVLRLVSACEQADIPFKVIEGLSYIEPCLTMLGIDGMEGLQIHDGIEVAAQDYPQLSPDRPALLAQVYSRLVASDLKEVLTQIYPDQHPVTLLHAAGMPAGEGGQGVEEIMLYEIDRSAAIDHLTTLYIPPLSQKSDLAAFAEAIATLRGPDGCPWDIKQTPQSMRDGFLEEVCEALDALDREDDENLREELGDVLLHLVMQTQMATEDGRFTLSDVIAGILAKIIRRHPHVWGDTAVAGSEEVVVNWEEIKKREKKAAGREMSSSILDNISVALPALARSQKLQKRVRKTGFDWQDIQGVYAKLQEEIDEVRSAETAEHQQEELGDLLFITVNLANWLGVDAETALREANLKFDNRFREVERLAQAENRSLLNCSPEELDQLWAAAKQVTG